MAGPDFKNGYKKGFEDGANSVEEGLPGWFGTFADMMTLLFAFFVLLAAISTMDPVKLQEMANSEGKSQKVGGMRSSTTICEWLRPHTPDSYTSAPPQYKHTTTIQSPHYYTSVEPLYKGQTTIQASN